MAREQRLKVWLAWTAGLGLAAALAPWFAAWQHLPDPVATHFGASGSPNGNMSRSGWVAFNAGQLLLALFFTWPRPRPGEAEGSVRGAPVRLGLVGFIAALCGTLSAVILWHNWERATWQQARPFAVLSLLPILGVPALLGLALAALALRFWPDRSVPPAGGLPEALPLAPGERAYWSGQASNGWFFLIALLVLIEGGLFRLMLGNSIGGYVLFGVHLLVLLLLELFSKLRVSVDERAITIRYGRLGWIRQRLSLDRVASAAAFELDPWEHGGWGYRGSLKLGRRAAVVVRAGKALRIDWVDGACFSITVDDAETAALLVNGFVQRRAAGGADSPPALTAFGADPGQRPLRA